MPSSSSFTYHGVTFVQCERDDESKTTRLVFDVPHTEQNRVGLQTLNALRDTALKSPVAVQLTVLDHLAVPAPSDRT